MWSATETAFLATPRLGMFSVAVPPGWSRPVPVWFEAIEGGVRLFSGGSSPKMRALREHGRAHLLVANAVGEPEAWLSVAGPVEFGVVDPAWLVALTARYWDLTQPTLRAQLDDWCAAVDGLALLTVRADDVRRYGL